MANKRGRRETIDPAYLGFETRQLRIADPVGEIEQGIEALRAKSRRVEGIGTNQVEAS